MKLGIFFVFGYSVPPVERYYLVKKNRNLPA
jgi:hypothetical protein